MDTSASQPKEKPKTIVFWSYKFIIFVCIMHKVLIRYLKAWNVGLKMIKHNKSWVYSLLFGCKIKEKTWKFITLKKYVKVAHAQSKYDATF
jgi:hypothetical protein